MVDFAFLDSGTGGIPYFLFLRQKMPDVNCVYVADTENFPYGEKTHNQIVSNVTEVIRKIIHKFNPKVIVIACNTMSVNALSVLREVFPSQQFVGTVPAIKLAASISKKRVIGLLATKSTIENPYNQDLKNQFAADCRMELRGDGDLISFIEHKSFSATSEEREQACIPAVNYFKEKGCDTIVLGCTHFLNIKDEMQKVCGPDITVVDSEEGVINRAIALYKGYGVLGDRPLGERVAEKASDFGAQGETSPFKTSVFVTGFSDKKDEKEYDVICKRYHLEFGGLL